MKICFKKNLVASSSDSEKNFNIATAKNHVDAIKNEINFVRTNLKKYIEKLLIWIKYLNGNKLCIEKKTNIFIKDGEALYKELITYLRLYLNSNKNSLENLEIHENLNDSSNDFVENLQQNDQTSVFNDLLLNKNQFLNRLMKYGKPKGLIGESVNFDNLDPELIVLKLLLDEDDVKKTNREIILNKNLKYFGISCGILPLSKKSITIVDFCEDFEPNSNINSKLNNFIKQIPFQKKNISRNHIHPNILTGNMTSIREIECESIIDILIEQRISNSFVIQTTSFKKDVSIDKNRHRLLNISIENITNAPKLIEKIRKLSPAIQKRLKFSSNGINSIQSINSIYSTEKNNTNNSKISNVETEFTNDSHINSNKYSLKSNIIKEIQTKKDKECVIMKNRIVQNKINNQKVFFKDGLNKDLFSKPK